MTDAADKPGSQAADGSTAQATQAPAADTAAATASTTTAQSAATQAPTNPPATVADGKEPEKKAAPPDWPDDWRDKLAGGDADTRKRLDRFQSPADVWKHARSLEQNQSKLKRPLPENATPEQLAEWRKENGIPETADGYDLTLADGLVVGEDDKPAVGEFLTEMHKVNADPSSVKAAMTSFLRLRERQETEQDAADASFKQEAEDALHAEWGPDYRKYVTLMGNLLDTAPAGLKDNLLQGRTADGKVIGNHPDVLRFLTRLALEVNPAAAVTGTTGAGGAAAIETEIDTLKALMGDKESRYWKGPEAQKLQTRYRDLVAARDKIKARAA